MAPKVERTRCSGQWTEAMFVSFIKNQLRGATRKWRPVGETLTEGRTAKGVYRCVGYGRESHAVPVTRVVAGKRVKNIHVDHREPVVPPETGFTTWDSFIERLFCEKIGLQLLCSECHDKKSGDERLIATTRRRELKDG